jgi:Fic family protein
MPRKKTLEELRQAAIDAQKTFEDAKKRAAEERRKETEKRQRGLGIKLEKLWNNGEAILPAALDEILADMTKIKLATDMIQSTLKKYGCLAAASAEDAPAILDQTKGE